MKLCVFGAGAVGGAAGAHWARAGHEVTLIARGEHGAAIRAKGLRLTGAGGDFTVRAACPESAQEAGPQDAVVVTAKAHAIAEAAEAIQPLLGRETVVLTAQNGIPYWYFQRSGTPWEGKQLLSVDPDGRALALIGVDRAVGGVVVGASDVIEPGVVRLGSPLRFAIGEPKEGISPRLAALARDLNVPGLAVAARPRLREEVWFKLLGNISFSMISVLTGADLKTVRSDEGTCALAREIMVETQKVGEALGVVFDRTIDARIAESRSYPAHKTSTLQDLERGRPMEIDAICGAVAEIGRMAQVPTPAVDATYALVRRLAEQVGCYPANPRFALSYGFAT